MSDYIPFELISNILARLPVDDVLRCTSVCKSWYKLIASPHFATLHLKLSTPNQEPRILIRYYKENYSLHRDDKTFDEIAEMDYPHSGDWKLIDCINGLLCFIYDPRGTIMLWNPSLRKSVVLPSKCRRDLSCVRSRYGYDHRCGIGFVATSNEHKIVRFSYEHKNGKRAAEIYQLSTGSWRDLKLDDCPFVDAYSRQVHLNGILHWFSYKQDPTTICAFDLKNEKSSALVVPSCLGCDYDDSSVMPCTFRDSLCLICTDADEICNIWVMKKYGKSDSWEKLCSVDKKQHGLNTYSVSGTVPMFRHNEELLFDTIYDDENSFARAQLVSYDYNTKKFKNLGVSADYSGCDPVCAYRCGESCLNEGPKWCPRQTGAQ